MPKQDYLTGQLLIAMPSLTDGCFRESVVLMCTHNDDHAMGVVVNKPISNLSFADILEQVGVEPHNPTRDCAVVFGGPVETKRGLVLHTLDYETEETVRVTDQIGLTATKQVLEDLNSGGREILPIHALLCMGHAGWSAGQLEHELMQNAWINAPASRDLVFMEPIEDIWAASFREIGLDPAKLSGVWSHIRDPDAPLN